MSMPTCTHQQSRQRPSASYAPNVVSSRNPAEVLVVAAVVLGSKTVVELATQSLVIPGTRESKPAKHGCSPSQRSTSSYRLLDKKTLSLPMVMPRYISKQLSRLPTHLHPRQPICQHQYQVICQSSCRQRPRKSTSQPARQWVLLRLVILTRQTPNQSPQQSPPR